MTPGAAAAFLAMSGCIGSAGAEHYARIAYERGATREEITEAWRLWRAEQESEVTVIHSDPRPDTLCACANPVSEHDGQTGKCTHPGCGCLWVRPGGRRTA